MTVAQIIDELKKMPQDGIVILSDDEGRLDVKTVKDIGPGPDRRDKKRHLIELSSY